MSETPLLLRQVPLFQSLSEYDLTRLARATVRGSFDDDEAIVEIGEAGRSLFVILNGVVRVVCPGRTSEYELARLGPGDFFGEMALLNDRPRSATVRAVDHVEVLRLDVGAFRSVVRETPELALELLQSLSDRMRNADEHISGLSDQVVRDPLTRLLNRRAFHDRVTQELDRARRYDHHFSLVILDLDHFKGINDALGHDAGDEVLEWVGRMLTEHTRSADCPFRVGGEEFAVLCPSTTPEMARVAAERFISVLGQARPPVEGMQVTASAGYASCPDHGTDFSTLYHAADQALHRAKRDGRAGVGEPQVPEPTEAE